MEKRLNEKLDTYISKFKDDIKCKIIEINSIMNNEKLIQYLLDYETLSLNKEDFIKRKRTKNVIILTSRCCAKRANGEQCTRRKKNDNEYCGTHLKGTPHGIVSVINNVKTNVSKVDVWAQDIHGIMYYIDNNNNVYQTEDVHKNKQNPKVIAKYVLNGVNYSIPEFNLF